jgi:hypothetical protein
VFTLLREHRYFVQVGTDVHTLRVEELVAGPAVWRSKFRLQIPASHGTTAEVIYGENADEVAEKAATVISQRG